MRKSLAMWDNGLDGVGRERSFPAGRCHGTLDWVYLAQVDTKSLISLFIDGHQFSPLISSQVCCISECPVANEVFAQFEFSP